MNQQTWNHPFSFKSVFGQISGSEFLLSFSGFKN